MLIQTAHTVNYSNSKLVCPLCFTCFYLFALKTNTKPVELRATLKEDNGHGWVKAIKPTIKHEDILYTKVFFPSVVCVAER